MIWWCRIVLLLRENMKVAFTTPQFACLLQKSEYLVVYHDSINHWCAYRLYNALKDYYLHSGGEAVVIVLVKTSERKEEGKIRGSRRGMQSPRWFRGLSKMKQRYRWARRREMTGLVNWGRMLLQPLRLPWERIFSRFGRLISCIRSFTELEI